MAHACIIYCTITVPFIPMLAWYLQLYGYVPAVLNVVDAEAPAAMLPVSQTPVSLVDECALASLFFHVTVVPTETVMVTGENTIPDIRTVLGEAAAGAGAGPVADDA